MTKSPFIRATEIWLPSADRKHLEFGGGIYGELKDFEQLSHNTTFQYDEGLPGKAWAAGHPIVLHDLVHSYFLRGESAAAAGLTCGVAVPIFKGADLSGVLVMFCGDDEEHIGALEVWGLEKTGSRLKLADGHFGNARPFEFTARHTEFGKGIGLPGEVWANRMPVLMADTGQGSRMLRWESAQKVGITRGVGIPLVRDDGTPWILTLLSALGTPIARRFECWVPNSERTELLLASAFSENEDEAATNPTDKAIGLEEAGSLHSLWLDGVPVISTQLASEPDAISSIAERGGYEAMVALPIIENGAVRSVVAWYN